MVKENDFRLYKSYIAHYGVKGMHWGIRRYQNPDGTLTELGKRKYRYETYTSKNLNENYIKALDAVYDTLNSKEKIFLNTEDSERFEKSQEYEYYLKRCEQKMSGLLKGQVVYDKEKNPVGFIDISRDFGNQVKIDIAVSSKHRGQGLSNELINQ